LNLNFRVEKFHFRYAGAAAQGYLASKKPKIPRAIIWP
jgi:hypothetical protein